MKQLNPKMALPLKLKNAFLKNSKYSLFLFFATLLVTNSALSQVPAYGTTGFNDPNFDQYPFATGTAYPSVMTATNVSSTGWSFHIGAIGAYVITQVDKGTGAYDGAMTATNVTTPGIPTLYQTFAFTSTNNSRFKLNSVMVKIDNDSVAPIPMILAGVVNGSNTGSTQNFVAMPGANWVTVTTSADPNFSNINGVIVINITGTTHVKEMSLDNINISAPVVGVAPPSFTTQPTNKSVCTNASTSFVTAASNAVSYFWLASTDGLIWNPINASNAGTTFSGYNTSALTVTNPSILLNGLYLGVTAVGSTGLNQGSNSARLFVGTIPTVPAIGGNSSVCVGSSTVLTNSATGGTWSITPTSNRATINSSGSVIGTNQGTVSVRYTLINSGCTNFATKSITVNALPVVPTITYALGLVGNPQAGAPTGSFCVGRKFRVAGSPNVPAGVFAAAGSASISGLDTVNINSVGAGSIKYTYTNTNGCSNSRTMSGNGFNCPGGRAFNSNANSTVSQNFSLFPNPAKGSVNLNFEYATSGSQISVTDIYGKSVITKALSIGNNNLDISKLSRGLYLVSLTSAEGIKTQKLIIE